MVSKLSDAEKINCIELYTSGKSCYDIARTYNVSHVAIQGILKRRGVILRSNSEAQRKYLCDEHFFDQIDTEAKAYFFGLLYADGCNLDSRNNITLSLQESDKHILETMSELIQPDKPLQFIKLKDKHPNWNDQYRIVICSEHMCKLLNSYGLVPRKSLIKTFPQIILDSDPEIQRHFIRGYFDGNGSSSLTSNAKSIQIRISSTYDMCVNLRNVINILAINNCIFREHRSISETIFYLSITKLSDGYVFMQWIYTKCNFYIVRKNNEYNELYKSII